MRMMIETMVIPRLAQKFFVCDSDEYEGADEHLIKDYTYQGSIANDLHPIIVP